MFVKFIQSKNKRYNLLIVIVIATIIIKEYWRDDSQHIVGRTGNQIPVVRDLIWSL